MSGQEDFIVSSHFTVALEGHSWGNFESVSGLGIIFEDIAMQDGNQNKIVNRPGRANAQDITLIRRFKKDPELYDWMKMIMDGKYRTAKRSGSIILHDDQMKPLVRFNFTGGWPKEWYPPTFSKSIGGNDTPMETIVLSIEDLELVR